MPQENIKEDITRHIGSTIVPPRSDTFKSPYLQDFAEIYIESRAENQDHTSQKIAALPQPADIKAEIFSEMRRLRQSIAYPGSSYGRLQATLFYKQAKFMEDFEDDYEGDAAFSMYYPDYESMSYEQLRTYFTWRGKVRAGNVLKTSLSYVFVYIYELINNIGVLNCQDGMNKLLAIWNEYRRHESKLDKYMSDWVKDYYITNDFAESFEDLLMENEIMRNLFGRAGSENLFDFYYRYSGYKIKQSVFYTPETEKKISVYFDHVVGAINRFMGERDAAFDDLVFTGEGNVWKPFSKAIYCRSAKEAKTKIVYFSKYRCENRFWTLSQNKVCKKNGRIILAYILKRIEQFLRKAEGFKYKLNADRTSISVAETGRLFPDPDSFFRLIDSAVMDFYKQSQRKIITVDTDRLEAIRANALMIQEKLLANAEEVVDEAAQTISAEETCEKITRTTAGKEDNGKVARKTAVEEAESEIAWPEAALQNPMMHVIPSAAAIQAKLIPKAPAEDIWDAFVQLLNQAEKTAVQLILRNASMNDLHEFSKISRMMLEVMIDNINQKAIEAIGDNIMELSDEIEVFDEYKDDLERVIAIECK